MEGLKVLHFTCSFCVVVASVLTDGGQLSVPGVTEGPLEGIATLKCRLETAGRWYVIKWSRLHENGSDTLLVSLPSGQMVPDWNPDIPKSLRMRIQPLITVQAGIVEFHLVLSPLSCEDKGRYRCRAVAAFGDPTGSTQLMLTQPPGTPHVIYNHEVWTLNSTFSVSCKAPAGIPPQEFLWYYKTPSMRNFLIAERQGETEYEENGCSMTSIRTLHVTVTTDSGGTLYRCALPGRVESNYDELSVHLPPPVSVFPNKGRSCTERGCALQAAESDRNVASEGTSVTLLTKALIGCSAVIVSLTGQFNAADLRISI